MTGVLIGGEKTQGEQAPRGDREAELTERRTWNRFSLRVPGKAQLYWHLPAPGPRRLLVSRMWRNTFLLLPGIHCVGFCYSSPSKLIEPTIHPANYLLQTFWKTKKIYKVFTIPRSRAYHCGSYVFKFSSLFPHGHSIHFFLLKIVVQPSCVLYFLLSYCLISCCFCSLRNMLLKQWELQKTATSSVFYCHHHRCVFSSLK